MHKTFDNKIIGTLIFSRKRKTYNSYGFFFLSEWEIAIYYLTTCHNSWVLGNDHYKQMHRVKGGVARSGTLTVQWP